MDRHRIKSAISGLKMEISIKLYIILTVFESVIVFRITFTQILNSFTYPIAIALYEKKNIKK